MTTKYDLRKMADILEKMNLVEGFLSCHFSFATVWKDSLQLQEYLNNQNYALQDKVELLQSVFAENCSPAFKEYILLLLNNNDILKYPVLSEKLLGYLNRNYLVAKLFSAQSLNEKYYDKIKNIVEKKSGKKVYLHQEIQPEILGGFILHFSDKIFDLSLRRRINQLQSALGR